MCRWGREAKCHNMILVLHAVAVCTSIVEGWRLVRLTSRSADEGNTWLYMDKYRFTRQPCRSFKPDSTPPLRQCIPDVELSSSAPLGTLAFRLLPRSLRLPCPIPRRDPSTESYQQRIAPLARTILALITEEAFRSRWSPVLLFPLVAMQYVPCYVTGCVGAVFTAMSPTELWQPDS
jgi:hypothetical protein